MPASGVGRRAHAMASWTLAVGFALAAATTLLTLLATLLVARAHLAMRSGGAPDAGPVQALVDLARIVAEAAFVAALLGAFGLAAALAASWRDRASRRALVVAPAVLLGAILVGPLLQEYTGVVSPTRPLHKTPFLLALGGALAWLVARSRPALLAAGAGTLALLAGAVHAHVYGPWWAIPLGRLPPLGVEDAWAGVGFTLLGVAMATHAKRVRRSVAPARRATRTEAPAGAP